MKKTFTLLLSAMLAAVLFVGTAQAAPVTHTIKPNDTFWKLSLHYNVPLKQLMTANKTVDPMNMTIGSPLHIPGGTEQRAMEALAADKQESAEQPASAKLAVTAPGGDSYTYSSKMELKATAYTSAAEENGKWGAVDYFGNKLKVGTVAVDPGMIPLGSRLYITGYRYNGLPAGGMVATATDIGGSIKGNRIDIFVPGTTRQARTFGIQNVTVYVID